MYTTKIIYPILIQNLSPTTEEVYLFDFIETEKKDNFGLPNHIHLSMGVPGITIREFASQVQHKKLKLQEIELFSNNPLQGSLPLVLCTKSEDGAVHGKPYFQNSADLNKVAQNLDVLTAGIKFLMLPTASVVIHLIEHQPQNSQ